ncbi:hypothetical protein IL992_38265 [Microbispora sp. NEAU-D428]|uniref:hypothetical protein n=1 Tax=Microbispora sitophila TaxID=2771537 RepID=UPI001865C5FD|nr:hypothetical protein [Microbispora sitophila]MBE3014974.1 hypothetical protein [Microbispora sitophila]
MPGRLEPRRFDARRNIRSALPDEARIAVDKVVGYFSGFGHFVCRGMADESLVIPLIGYRASRAWDALEPFIRRACEIPQMS